MGKIKCISMVVGPISTNCYIVFNEETKECVIIDPGFEGGKIASRIAKEQLVPVAILLTHGHFDHISGVKELLSYHKVPVYASVKERETLRDVEYNLSGMMGDLTVSMEADVWVKEGQEVSLCGTKFRCIETPGHTMGGVCFYFPMESMMFVGDTVFYESVGRTDFLGGSSRMLVDSLRNKILPLPGDVILYPGHGPSTTIEHEQRYNPYAN